MLETGFQHTQDSNKNGSRLQNLAASPQVSKEMNENEIMEQPFGGEGFLTDPMLERDLKGTPRKFTLHCTGFIFLIIACLVFCKWVMMRFKESKN